MSDQGFFLIHRSIFKKLWHDGVACRLFIWLIGKACFADGVKIGDISLIRGQYVRSIRNLIDDLEFVDGRKVVRYSKDTIARAIKRLENDGRVTTRETRYGTLFTIENYEKYQRFLALIGDASEPPSETARETAKRQQTDNNNEGRTKANNPPTPQGGGEHFNRFWDEYPRPIKKAETLKVWRAMGLDAHAEEILAGLRLLKESAQWKRDGGRYQPGPKKFLEDERWKKAIDQGAKKNPHMDAWRAGRNFRYGAELIPASALIPSDAASGQENPKTPNGFKSRRTGEFEYFTAFEIE